MKKNLRWIIPICLGGLLLCWMLFSTKWISNMRNDVQIMKINPIDQEMLGLSFYETTNFEQLDTLYDTLRFDGYVYNISYATDEEATRSMILLSSEVQYQIQLPEIVHYAHTLFESFDQTGKRFAGFDLEFSPLGLKDGTYKIILQVEESGTPVTRVPTGYEIEKVNGYSTLQYRPSQPAQDISEASGWANGGFDQFELAEDGTLDLAGWAMVDRAGTTETTNVYIEIANNGQKAGTFSTTKKNITHIAEYFDDENLYSAGFLASIPNVSPEGLEIRIFVEYQGTFYKCSYHFEPDEGQETLVSVSDLFEGPAEEDVWAQAAGEQVEELTETLGWANGGISQFELREDGTLCLAGWGIVDGLDSTDQTEVYVQIDSGTGPVGTFRTKKESIPYIAEYFNNAGYETAGFRVAVPNVNTKDVTVRLFVKYEDGFYRCSYHFEPDGSGVNLVSVSDLE